MGVSPRPLFRQSETKKKEREGPNNLKEGKKLGKAGRGGERVPWKRKRWGEEKQEKKGMLIKVIKHSVGGGKGGGKESVRKGKKLIFDSSKICGKVKKSR